MNNSKNKWYAAGLHFECLQCGRCCSGPNEGYIWVTRPEIRLIAQHLNLPVGELKKKFLKRVGLRRTIIEDARTRDCIFLRQDEKGKGCAIYPVRPKQCRTWPFWPGNLASPDGWNTAAHKCPGINRGENYTPQRIQTKNSEDWWKTDKEIVERVGRIYKWLDKQLADKFACDACGKCCDFESFGHRLFVTSPEMLYFSDKLTGPDVIASAAKQSQAFDKPATSLKQMTGRCPYQVEGPVASPEMVSLSNHKCTVYPYRFAGCRIFSCKGDADFQSELTEAVLKKFKSLCDEFQIPYRYVDLPTALKSFTAANAEKNINL